MATRNKAPHFSDLSKSEQKKVATKLFKIARTGRTYLSAGKYDVVGSSSKTKLRERARVEFGGEDDALTSHLRAQFLNLARNGVRNNETLNAILNQFKLNVVGTVGGKAYFDFGKGFEQASENLRHAFADYASFCEFYDGMSLRDLLRIVLDTRLIGGDIALVFDDAFVGDTGRVMAFEPDSIANLEEGEFKKLYPGYTQSCGRVKNKIGQFCGCFVSSCARGKTEFKKDDCYFLKCDPAENPMSRKWMFLGNFWRFNQGRGTPSVAAPLGSLMDINTLLAYEIESAKKNAQTIAQLVQTHADVGDPMLSDPNAAIDTISEDATDAEVDAAVDAAQALEEPPVTFDRITEAGTVYEVMPENAKLELLDTKHPNPNMNEFIRLVAARGGWSMALATVYTTGKVETSYTGFRGEQILTWPVFEFWQKELERVCDWVLRRWFAWAGSNNHLPGGLMLPDGWTHRVRWSWPKMREVNQVDAQNAWNMGLKNGTLTYAQILGPDWKEQLAAAAEEKQFCLDHGFAHPSMETDAEVNGVMPPDGDRREGEQTNE